LVGERERGEVVGESNIFSSIGNSQSGATRETVLIINERIKGKTKKERKVRVERKKRGTRGKKASVEN